VTDRPRPNLFLIGAAKSGTTSMHAWLAQHPDILMSAVKEPSHFGRDLAIEMGWASEDRYLSLFAAGGDRRYRGEASPSYLLSSTAASEVHAFAPDSRIVVILREPASMVASLFLQLRSVGVERHRDLFAAVRASEAGDRSSEVRGGLGVWLRYREAVRYADQLRRWHAHFPPQQIHVELFDDLVADPVATVDRLTDWLGLPRAPVDTAPANVATEPRSFAVQRLLHHPTGVLRKALLAAQARPRGHRAWEQLVRWNMRPARDRPDRDDLQALRAELGLDREVDDLEQLLQRDLTRWR
jgi:hypothetical protein